MPAAEGTPREPARSLAWIGLACLAAAAWLAWPLPRGGADDRPPLRVVLVDASAPVRLRRPSYASHLARVARREAARAVAAEQELALALFDRGARWWVRPAQPDAVIERLASGAASLGEPERSGAADLAAGLALARDALLAPGRPPGVLVVVGDGTARGGDPAPLLDALALAGTELRFDALSEPALPDARVHALELPTRIEAGAPLAAALTWSVDPGSARAGAESRLAVELELEDARGVRRIDRALEVPADADPRRTLIELSEAVQGAVVLRARIVLEGAGALRGGDPLPANDVALATARVGDALVALALAPADHVPTLRELLVGATPGLDWIVRTPAEAADAPDDLDLVATIDLAPNEWPAARLEATLAAGGAWFRCGGWSWLAAPRGDLALSLADRAPLAPAESGVPPVERVLLVDGSGSMRGEPFESVRDALIGMLPYAPDRDRVVLRLFSNHLAPPVVLARAGSAPHPDVVDRLRALDVPGGPTEILWCLERLVQEPIAPPAERAAVLLLSDGREEDAVRIAERSAEIRAALRASRRDLTVLAAGPEADEGFLLGLLEDPERLVRAEDFDTIAERFREAVGGERCVEGDAARALPARPDGPPIARALADAFDRPLAWARAARCEARPGAGVLLANEDGLPLLAVGADGRTAALATTFGAAWSGESPVSDLAPVWRALARRGEPGGGPRARVADGRLVLEGLGEDAPVVVAAEFSRESPSRGPLASASREALGTLELFPPTPPSGRDRSDAREARLPADLRLALESGGATLRAHEPPLVLPLEGPAGAGLLPEARRPYHAPTVEPDPGLARAPAPRPHPAAGWVLGAGLFAVFGSAIAGLLQARGRA